MGYTICEDCGCRVYNGYCTNCDEESYILTQDEKNDVHVDFDRDFYKKVNEQHDRAMIRKLKNNQRINNND